MRSGYGSPRGGEDRFPASSSCSSSCSSSSVTIIVLNPLPRVALRVPTRVASESRLNISEIGSPRLSPQRRRPAAAAAQASPLGPVPVPARIGQRVAEQVGGGVLLLTQASSAASKEEGLRGRAIAGIDGRNRGQLPSSGLRREPLGCRNERAEQKRRRQDVGHLLLVVGVVTTTAATAAAAAATTSSSSTRTCRRRQVGLQCIRRSCEGTRHLKPTIRVVVVPPLAKGQGRSRCHHKPSSGLGEEQLRRRHLPAQPLRIGDQPKADASGYRADGPDAFGRGLERTGELVAPFHAR